MLNFIADSLGLRKEHKTSFFFENGRVTKIKGYIGYLPVSGMLSLVSITRDRHILLVPLRLNDYFTGVADWQFNPEFGAFAEFGFNQDFAAKSLSDFLH